MEKLPKEDLQFISQNNHGNFWFYYKIEGVKNHINPKAKPRDEALIVGLNKKKVVEYMERANMPTKLILLVKKLIQVYNETKETGFIRIKY